MLALTQHRYGKFNVFQLERVATPTPKDNEVRIKVHASGVNDWELGLMEGKPYIIRVFLGLFRPRVHIVGCEVSGVVDMKGSQVSTFGLGDRVYGDLSEQGFGSHAEYVCVTEDAVSRMPTNISFEQAAAIPHAGLLMLQSLHDIGDLKEGQSLLVNGAGGGVGTLALQYAKLFNVLVTGVDSAIKKEYMVSLGFDQVIDYEEEDFTELGQQYDVILDAKTTRSPFALIRVLKPGGIYVTIGGNTSRILQCVMFGKWIARRHHKHIRVLGLKPNRGLDHLTDLVESGKILPMIDRRYPLVDAVDAIKHFAAAKHKGKVVISVANTTGCDE